VQLNESAKRSKFASGTLPIDRDCEVALSLSFESSADDGAD